MDTVKGEDLPKESSDIDDALLKKIIICSETGRPFRFAKKELDFYRQH